MLLFTTGIQVSLERISGRNYRNYAAPGTRVLDGVIPRQYDTARTANRNIKTVVMTGGGNDVLLGTCTGDCKATIDQVAVKMKELRAKMATDGVEDVILISYGYPSDPARKPALDYSRQLIPTQCLKTEKPALPLHRPGHSAAGQSPSTASIRRPRATTSSGRWRGISMQAEGMRR